MTDQRKYLLRILKEIKQKGDLSIEKELRILQEIDFQPPSDSYPIAIPGIYSGNFSDFELIAGTPNHPDFSHILAQLKTLEELLEQDKQREKDGFPKKIKVGRMVRPGKGKNKIVVVPMTTEEKFVHDQVRSPEEEESGGGSGEGEEGEVISEEPIDQQESSGAGPGDGEGENHELDSTAYDLGKALHEKFELPNLKDKGKKRALTKYTYDMTDRHRGFGQLLDKKATLRKIVETNIALGKINPEETIDPSEFLVAPRDKIYRVLSREKDYESQAMIFFLRDYSGSMSGKPTELVCQLHVFIYSWLLYQYENRAEYRFILHDTQAKEVPDFYTYYNSRVIGGTRVYTAFKLVNEIVEKENLAQDYNIYVFHGTDGDDWDKGEETIRELKKMALYANRVGITIARRGGDNKISDMEKYIKASGILNGNSVFRMSILRKDTEAAFVEEIRKLLA